MSSREPLLVDIITIFPSMFYAFAGESILKRAENAGIVSFRCINPRSFTKDKHQTVDDSPYGGGPGMIMKPEPIFAAVESVKTEKSRIILMTPQGKVFSQKIAKELSLEKHLIFICGHYEGIDERIREHLATDEISIGDYVLTNGTLAAAVVVDAVVRLLPGALGAGEEATQTESFMNGMLEYPQYTRPEVFRGWRVPEVLLSGNHAEIAKWRQSEALKRTKERRPDLLSDQ